MFGPLVSPESNDWSQGRSERTPTCRSTFLLALNRSVWFIVRKSPEEEFDACFLAFQQINSLTWLRRTEREVNHLHLYFHWQICENHSERTYFVSLLYCYFTYWLSCVYCYFTYYWLSCVHTPVRKRTCCSLPIRTFLVSKNVTIVKCEWRSE